MQVTQEDGGRLNAFAKEPRMEVLSKEASHSNGSRLILVGGSLLVIALMAFASREPPTRISREPLLWAAPCL